MGALCQWTFLNGRIVSVDVFKRVHSVSGRFLNGCIVSVDVFKRAHSVYRRSYT